MMPGIAAAGDHADDPVEQALLPLIAPGSTPRRRKTLRHRRAWSFPAPAIQADWAASRPHRERITTHALPALSCPRGDRRRRHHGLLARLPPRARGLAGGRAARAQEADQRQHVPRRRPGRPAAHQRQHHPAAQALGRALRPARGRDRPGERLEAERRPAARLHRGPHGRAQAPGHDRAQLRPRDAPLVARRGQGPLAADGRLRPGRRRLPADRRPGQPLGHHPGAGEGRPPAGCHDPRGLRGHAASAAPGGASPAWSRSRARSPARSWRCAPANGRRR